MDWFWYAVVAFALAALGGVYLANLHIQGKHVSIGLALVHGVLAVSGVLLLVRGIAVAGASLAINVSLVLFLLAAVGGLTLFFIHTRRKPLPKWLIGVHATVALISFLVLLVPLLMRA